MPQQKRKSDGDYPVSLRLTAQERLILDDLMNLGDNQTQAIKSALRLAHIYHYGFEALIEMRRTDVLTNYGESDPNETLPTTDQ